MNQIIQIRVKWYKILTEFFFVMFYVVYSGLIKMNAKRTRIARGLCIQPTQKPVTKRLLYAQPRIWTLLFRFREPERNII